MYNIYMEKFDIIVMGQRIKELRLSAGYGQVQLGEIVGVRQSTIADYERGKATPSFQVLFRLAKVLHTTTDYLLGLVDFE